MMMEMTLHSLMRMLMHIQNVQSWGWKSNASPCTTLSLTLFEKQCKTYKKNTLSSCVLQVGNDISTILLLLETSENHLCSWNVLLWIQKVLIEGILTPNNTLILVCLTVGVSFGLSSVSSKQTSQVWALLVTSSLLSNVALGASTSYI